MQQAAAAKVYDLTERLLQLHRGELDFAEILGPLERKAERLGGVGRRECFAAFTAQPDGFRRCVEKVLARPDTRNPLGLLVKLIRDGEHELESIDHAAAVADSRSAVDRRPLDPCMACDRPAPLNEVGDLLLCDECAGAAEQRL